MKLLNRSVTFSIMIMMLAGCQGKGPQTWIQASGRVSDLTMGMDAPTAEQADPTPILKSLEASAASTEQALTLLSASQPLEMIQAIETAPLMTEKGGMGGRATVDWAGPVEPLVRRIGEMTGYKLKVFGATPPIPVMVSLSAKDVIVADILKNAGLQIASKGTVVVFPEDRIIELRYHNA